MKKMEVVGQYVMAFNTILGKSLPCGNIYQSKGLREHIRKRHPAYVEYMHLIPEIIASPDYIGGDPQRPESIELVKKYGEHLLVSVTLDAENGYLYVSSFYDIKPSKLERRKNSGRLRKYEL